MGEIIMSCPATGQEVATGIEMDAAAFLSLPDVEASVYCPICKVEHGWSKVNAWLCEASGRVTRYTPPSG